MADKIRITTPLTEEQSRKLKVGDSVLISGVIYSARDAAHKVMTETLARGEKLPIDWSNQIVYYLGPTPAKPGNPIGSCGPTTSGRMDEAALCQHNGIVDRKREFIVIAF
ncbi:fumarate hydratase C-terminal domain-containing protein [Veillonella infantium]|uniref:fumarate hydratase C-terminal domain-containing protein n=1 Tax=Veillonella infantium TaxID=1911679 RepID=UPI0026EAC730|nr:fumarate hydratase C-terminal domain-containing protein [Veillonella infantium]